MEHRAPERTLTLVTPPSSEPINVEEAKLFLRIDTDEELNTIGDLIAAARELLDGANGRLGRCLMAQTWRLTLDRFPCDREIKIPLPPLQSISSVKYLDTTDVEQTLDAAAYRFSADDWSGKILLKSGMSWPATIYSPGAVNVEFVAGYANGIPAPLRHAIKLIMSHWFENREPVNIGNLTTELPMMVEDIIGQYRVF